MADTLEIREAVPEDAEKLGETHVLAWQKAYRGLLPDVYLDGLSVTERQQMWEETLAGDERSTRVLVAARSDEICGFAVIGPARDAVAESGTGELYAINLHPDVWRQGIGTALVAACNDTLRTDGYTQAILWVLVGNDRARRFYEALGWRCDGIEKHGRVLGADTHEIRYSIALAGGGGAVLCAGATWPTGPSESSAAS